MATKKVIVQNEHGIHARVAMHVVNTVQKIPSKITICMNCKQADACSILELLMLGASKGSEIEVQVCGGDEEKFLQEISQIFSDGAGI
jgi:phosphocarrier protein HPr/phosphocarrier protein